MKYLTALLSGIVFVVLLSLFVSPFINEAYISYYDIQPGPDGEAELANFLIFIQWPIFFMVGAASGYIIHKKYLTKSSMRT